MGYLILQILVFMIMAAVVGFVVGWLCRTLASERQREISASQSSRRLDDVEAQRERLEAQLAEAANTRKALLEEIAKAKEDAGERAKSMRKLERDHASAQIKLEARERELARLGAELEARRDADDGAARPASAIGLPRSNPFELAEDDPGMPPLLAAPEGQADDLQRINGIGPSLENTLNELGIFHYRQIAELTAENLAWIDRQLRFKGRIEREDWIGQAKRLADAAVEQDAEGRSAS